MIGGFKYLAYFINKRNKIAMNWPFYVTEYKIKPLDLRLKNKAKPTSIHTF